MKNNLTFIGIIQDRSGSMESLTSDVIGGYNSFVDEQKRAPGECLLSLWQFNTLTSEIYNGVPIQKVPHLTIDTYQAQGGTAYYDAVGIAIGAIGSKLEAIPEADRPARVVVVIMTDGFENSSHQFTGAKIRQMIQHQTDVYNWQFIFIGAGMDAIAVGEAMGMKTGQIMSAGIGGQSVNSAYNAVSSNVRAYRMSAASDVDKLAFKKEQRDEQLKQGAVKDKLNTEQP